MYVCVSMWGAVNDGKEQRERRREERGKMEKRMLRGKNNGGKEDFLSVFL